MRRAKSDIQRVGPRSPRDLQHLSASNLTAWEECPTRWACAYVLGMKSKPTEPMKIGSAVHKAIECVIKRQPFDGEHRATLEKIPDTEKAALQQYVSALPTENIIAAEYEATINWRAGVPPILMYIDLVYVDATGALVLVDHKTNRSYKGQEWWQRQLQPLIYAWAARVLWPQFPRVRFRIGYVNLGTDVEWETDPADDALLLDRMGAAWDAMLAAWERFGGDPARMADAFQPTLCDGCSQCPIQATCPLLQGALSNYQGFVQGLNRATPAKRWRAYKQLAKIVDGLLEEARAEVKALVEAQGELRDGDGVITLKEKSKRKLGFGETWAALCRVGQEYDPDMLRDLWASADDTFTVKVTAVDALVKRHPELKDLVKRLTYYDTHTELVDNYD